MDQKQGTGRPRVAESSAIRVPPKLSPEAQVHETDYSRGFSRIE
jgi:hypothetical protein